MSEQSAPPASATGEGGTPPGQIPSVARRLALYQRAGGIITPVLTAVFAFLVGGLVVLATGHDPLDTYKGIFNGAGFNWIFHPTINSDCTSAACNSAFNLQQTLLSTSALVMTGLAVAFAFRCGLFNIGGQGQYLVGAYVAIVVGSSWANLAKPLHIFVAIGLAALAGAAWAGIAGFLKATVGAHEVITTIMLNWIAIYVGSYLFGQGGPLQNTQNVSNPVSNDVKESAKLPVFWGDPRSQGLHVGIFIALASLVAFYLILNRTTLGYQVRAVGFSPEAARYGGISVARSYFLAMAISGLFAGIGGAIDMLGWQFRLGSLDVLSSQIGFIGIAVALLGRNTAIGTGLGALIFGALLYGASTRNLDLAIKPELAGNLTLMIQAFILLFIGADVIILYLWTARKKLRIRQRPAEGAKL